MILFILINNSSEPQSTMKLTSPMKFILAFAFLSLSTANTQAQEVLKLTLKQALEIARSDNPTLKVANQEIELKQTAKKEAVWNLLPEANLVGSYTRTLKKQTFVMGDQQVKVGTDNSYSGGLSVSLPVFAPSLYKSIHLSKSDVELAVEQARASELDLINQVTKAYFQLLLTQDSYEVLKKSYAQSQENFRVVNEKFKQGRVSEYDKISAEVQMRSLKPNVVSARNGVNLAKLQLKVLMGITADIDLQTDDNLKNYEMQLFQRQLDDSNYHFSLQNNTDLKQLEINAKILKQNLQLEKTNFMPMLSVSFQYMYTTLTDNFRFSSYKWNPYSTIGLNLTIPLFKGSNFTKMKQTRIQMQQLEENRINTERQLNMQATSYLDNMSASAEQVVSNREAVAQAIKGRDIANKRYEVGKGTILELNSSEVALTQAELTYNQSIFDYLSAKADLDKVLGWNKEE